MAIQFEDTEIPDTPLLRRAFNTMQMGLHVNWDKRPAAVRRGLGGTPERAVEMAVDMVELLLNSGVDVHENELAATMMYSEIKCQPELGQGMGEDMSRALERVTKRSEGFEKCIQSVGHGFLYDSTVFARPLRDFISSQGAEEIDAVMTRVSIIAVINSFAKIDLPKDEGFKVLVGLMGRGLMHGYNSLRDLPPSSRVIDNAFVRASNEMVERMSIDAPEISFKVRPGLSGGPA